MCGLPEVGSKVAKFNGKPLYEMIRPRHHLGARFWRGGGGLYDDFLMKRRHLRGLARDRSAELDPISILQRF